MACGGSAPIKSLWNCTEKQILFQKLGQEDYDG